MIGNHPFAKSEKQFLVGSLLLLLLGFFYHLGIYPLFLEEPRRGIIAMEMIFQQNYWVPTQAGDLYFRKPPVYNWVLIGAYKLFGAYSELATRFFSVLSHLALSWLTFVLVRKETNLMMGILVAFSLLVAADILVYFSTLGEIDLFYALITACSIFAIYYFGKRRRLWVLFLIVYTLTAIGFLTKGLTSLPFTAITLLLYFIHKKQFRLLLTVPHFIGIALFLTIIGGYFYQYHQYADALPWWPVLFSESANKTVGGGLVKWLTHLIVFPLDTIKNVLPAGFFIVLVFKKDLKAMLRKNPFVWFCALVFVFNFPVYWLAAGGKSRYIYALFPFLIIPLVYLGLLNNPKNWSKLLRVFAIIMLSVLTAAIPGLFFIPVLASVPDKPVLFVILLVLALTLWFYLFKQKVRPYLILIGAFVMLKLVCSAVVPATRQLDSDASKNKQTGLEIAQLTDGAPLYRLGDIWLPLTIVFYLERERKQVLYQKEQFQKGFFFCYEKDLPTDLAYKIHKEFVFGETTVCLIELTN